MSQAPSEKPEQSATVRAEELLDSLGRRLGLFAAQTGQRIQHAAASIREEADQMDQPNTSSVKQSSPSKNTPAGEKAGMMMERSEELVDRAAQRLSQYAILAGFQIQKATARVREEAEDIWAEAQNIRNENSRKLQQ